MTTLSLIHNSWALLISLLLMLLGNGLQGTLLGIRGVNEGFSTLSISLISTGYYLGYFIGSFIVPKYIKSIGYVRVFAALVAIASVAAIIYALQVNLHTWVIMRVITGFCFAGIYMVAESWLNSTTNNENRGKVLGLYVISIYLGMILGQALINFGSIDTYHLFAVTSIVISLASVPLLLTKTPIPQVDSVINLSIKELYNKSPLGVIATFLTNFMVSIIIGTSVIYAQSVGMSTKLTTIFVSSAYVGCVIFQYPIAFFADRMDRRNILIIITVLSGLLSSLAAFQSNHIFQVFLFFILGGVTIPLYSICIAYVNDRLEPEEVLPATSALLIISGVSSIFAPFIVGILISIFNPNFFFIIIAVAAISTMAFAIYRKSQSNVIRVDDLVDFSPVSISPTAATMSLTSDDTQLEFDFIYDDHKLDSEV